MNSDFLNMHKTLRNTVEGLHRSALCAMHGGPDAMVLAAKVLLGQHIYYGVGRTDGVGGAYYKFDSKNAEPATWKRTDPEWQNQPPGLECAGFLEAVMYASGVSAGRVLTYHSLRDVDPESRLFREARAKTGDESFNVRWIPEPGRSTITQDAGLTGSWPNGVHLIYYRKEFEPSGHDGGTPHEGDVVFFQYEDERGFHFHVGLWARVRHEDGLIHSSPAWERYGLKSGPKFTPMTEPYYREFLAPQRRFWAEWHGTSVVRTKRNGGWRTNQI